jgi:hypothetical protein
VLERKKPNGQKIVHRVFTTKLENALKKLGEKLDKATISLQSLISLKDKTERKKNATYCQPLSVCYEF